MKKWRSVILMSVLTLSLGGCSSQTPQEKTNTVTESTESTKQIEIKEESSVSSMQLLEIDQESNILIAYFTWADNTVVEHSEEVDVDATTSASVLVPGNTAQIADWIQQEIGGDLFSIVANEPYSSDYDECLDRAADEKADNARPALSAHVENMDQYDKVFIGYPNWWYTCPMAIHSFIEEYDLSEKEIVLFCTHGTGGLASSVEDIVADLPKSCTIEDHVLGVYRPEVSGSQKAVQDWLSVIGY